jgi:hypothetical protein
MYFWKQIVVTKTVPAMNDDHGLALPNVSVDQPVMDDSRW